MTLQRIINIVLLASALTVFGKSAAAAEYEVDIEGMHAAVQFRIYHLGYSVLTGRFNDFGGTFTWDKDNPEGVVDQRDDQNGQHRFGIMQNGTNTFVKRTFWTWKNTRKRLSKAPNTTAMQVACELEGILTLHGVSKPITIDMKYLGEGDDPWGGYRAGFEGHVTIRRADFGMTYELGPKSETMDLDLYIEGVRK